MRYSVLAAVLAVLFFLPHPAAAQDEKPGAAPPEAVMKVEAAVAKPLVVTPSPRRDADARHCLQHATNSEIHRCAEKYRPIVKRGS